MVFINRYTGSVASSSVPIHAARLLTVRSSKAKNNTSDTAASSNVGRRIDHTPGAHTRNTALYIHVFSAPRYDIIMIGISADPMCHAYNGPPPGKMPFVTRA